MAKQFKYGEEARRALGLTDQDTFILSYGGSMGAEKVNEAMIAVMRDYARSTPNVHCLHATGKIEYEAAMQAATEAGLIGHERIAVQEYIYDMPLRMAAADIVVCRAGAMTLTELAVMHKTAVLIPSPNVTNNHQYKNADVLRRAGAAVLIEEKDLTDEGIVSEIRSLVESPERRKALESRIGAFADADTEKRILSEILALSDENRLKLSDVDRTALRGAGAIK